MKRLALLLMLPLLLSCKGANPQSPVIVDFSAESYSIAAGSQTVLHWEVFNADSVRIDASSISVGDVPLKGSATVAPTVSTWYRLSASNKNSLIQRTLNITVK